MAATQIPDWAKADEESNNLFYSAIGAGAPADGLLFKSSAQKYLAAKHAQAEHLLDVVRDKRLKYFDPDIGTNIKSNNSAKSAVRQAYNFTCLLCGKSDARANWPLTVAHIVAHTSQLTYDEFGPPRYADRCDPASIRNRIVLCGNKTNKGSCHYLYDNHYVIIYYDGFDRKYKSLCLVPFLGSYCHTAYQVRTLNFPDTLNESEYPYRRLLAWRIRCAAVKQASYLDPSKLDTLVRMSEFSEAAEIAEEDFGEEGDEGNESSTLLSTGNNVADALGAAENTMSEMPAFSSEVGSPQSVPATPDRSAQAILES